MVNDLLELKDTALKVKASINGKEVVQEWILDDKDDFWLKNKYWHWKDVKGGV